MQREKSVGEKRVVVEHALLAGLASDVGSTQTTFRGPEALEYKVRRPLGEAYVLRSPQDLGRIYQRTNREPVPAR